MSAIWGCVDLSGAALPEGLNEAMEAPLRAYKIDRFAAVARGAALMGCGVQYLTREAAAEPLPIWDGELCFTADCYLDNRDELLAQLCPARCDVPDGELLYLAYKKWGGQTPGHVLGAWAYAAWHPAENRLELAVDHVLNRALYYGRRGSRVYFSTLIEPILQGIGQPPVLNEEWAALFLALATLEVQTEPVSTPYQGVSRMVAAHTRSFTPQGERQAEYWNPTAARRLRLRGEGEYRERFVALMETAAGQVTRTDGQVGVLLSSGFDSCAVAAFAAPALAARGKSLLAYTHVPVPGYKSQYHGSRTPNEQPGVERMCALYPNIVPHFMATPQRNAIGQVADIMRYYDVPYKSLTNAAWLDALNAEAAGQGCKILLDGQDGNVTISAGSALTYVATMLRRGRVAHALAALNRYCLTMGYSRRALLGHMALTLVPFGLRRLPERDLLAHSFVNRQWAQSLGIARRDARLAGNSQVPRQLTHRQERRLTFSHATFALLADQLTKRDLRYGTLTRDITRDKRIFEFCLSLPMRVKVNAVPETRRLVRCYLADRLPPEMLHETAPRGRQSGDWLDRLTPGWPAHYRELRRVCLAPGMEKYIDTAKVEAQLERFAGGPPVRDEYDFLRLGYVYALGVFLQGRRWGQPG